MYKGAIWGRQIGNPGFYAGWGVTVGLLGWLLFWAFWSAPPRSDESVDPSLYLREPAAPAVTPAFDGSPAQSGRGLISEDPPAPPPSQTVDPVMAADGPPAAPTADGGVPPGTADPVAEVPPMALPETAAPAPGPPPVVQAILTARDRRLAVVEDRIVGVGDTIGAYVVIEVQRDGLVVEDERGATRRLPLER